MAVSSERLLRDAFAELMREARAAVGHESIVRALEGRAGSPWRAIGDPFDDAFDTLEPIFRRAFKRGVRQGRNMIGVSGMFTSDRRSNYPAQRAADLLHEWKTEQTLRMRRLIAEGVRPGMTPTQTAKLIRAVIGLDERSANAVIKQRDAFARDGKTLPSQANAIADQYAERLRASRAKLVGMNEVNIAANTGKEALWLDAADQGLLPRTTRRRWIVVEDEKLCPICRLMDGQEAPLDGEFTLPNGDGVTTPGMAHPRCRCDEELIIPTTWTA